jgi:hypothetical protein
LNICNDFILAEVTRFLCNKIRKYKVAQDNLVLALLCHSLAQVPLVDGPDHIVPGQQW